MKKKKIYTCLHSANCPITITTRKECKACRLDKCLKQGMKKKVPKKDKTNGDKRIQLCTIAVPPSLAACSEGLLNNSERIKEGSDKSGDKSDVVINGSGRESTSKLSSQCSGTDFSLIEELMSVEHLWYYSEEEMQKMSEESLHNLADFRIIKIVKWRTSLPLIRNVSIDDQKCLLPNSWCQLLLLSYCFRSITGSVNTPEGIRVSQQNSVFLHQTWTQGSEPIIERILNLTDHLRRLRVDQNEYVCLKVLVLLSSDSDVASLQEPGKILHAQDRVIQALQMYTMYRDLDNSSKFKELLLWIPELERTCQMLKHSLRNYREEEEHIFKLLVELFRG